MKLNHPLYAIVNPAGDVLGGGDCPALYSTEPDAQELDHVRSFCKCPDAYVVPCLLLRSEDKLNVTGHQLWGMSLMGALGKFVEQVATGDGPLSTTIDVAFKDVTFPAVHIWATTDDKEPAARCAELADARRALEVMVEQLRARLAAIESASAPSASAAARKAGGAA